MHGRFCHSLVYLFLHFKWVEGHNFGKLEAFAFQQPRAGRVSHKEEFKTQKRHKKKKNNLLGRNTEKSTRVGYKGKD